MIRHISIDFGTTTSVVCYTDIENNKNGEIKFVKFDNTKDYVPTIILKKGTTINRRGKEVVVEEKYGWEAYNKQEFFDFHETNFKIKLISNNFNEKQHAMELTKKFFRYLYNQYKHDSNAFVKGTVISTEYTFVTYPARFPQDVQNFLKEAAIEAGFQNDFYFT